MRYVPQKSYQNLNLNFNQERGKKLDEIKQDILVSIRDSKCFSTNSIINILSLPNNDRPGQFVVNGITGHFKYDLQSYPEKLTFLLKKTFQSGSIILTGRS